MNRSYVVHWMLTLCPALIATSMPAAAQVGSAQIAAVFEIVPFHSQVEFSVPFMGLTSVKGSFEEFSGAMVYEPAKPVNSSITFIIQSASLHTGNASRDKHLRSSDFFDVEKHPTIKFQSGRIEARRGARYVVQGVLTMRGVARPITIPARLRHGVVRNEDGLDYVGFDLALRLDWRDFGIPAGNEHNSWFQPAKMLVNDSVDIVINIEADRRVPSRMHYPGLDAATRLVAAQGVEGVTRRRAALEREHPDSLAAFVRPLADLGNALIERGRLNDGIAILRLSANADPKDAEAQAMLGRAYLGAGMPDSAAALFRRALESDGDNAVALELLRRLERSPARVVEGIERGMLHAQVTHDAEYFERLELPEFRFTGWFGETLGKAQDVAAVREPSGRRVVSYGVDDVAIRFYGQTAIVWGKNTLATRLGDSLVTSRSRFTHVYVKEGDFWRLAAAHASELRSGAAAVGIGLPAP